MIGRSRWDAAFACLAIGTGAVLLYLGRSMTFWFDEWGWLTLEGGPRAYFRPWNEHWTTLPLVLHRLTFSFFELRSYLPYHSEVVALHLVAVTGAYLLMRPRLGPRGATILAFPLLLLGVGSENLYWAFQTGFVGSVMFGVWALYLVERSGARSAVAAALLLVLGLMCSGIGLFFVAAVATRVVLDAGLPRIRALSVVPAVVAYLVWYGTVGHGAVEGLAGPSAVARFVGLGVGHSTAALIGFDFGGLGVGIGLAAFGALVAATAFRFVRGQGRPLAAGSLVGLAGMYVALGLTRADRGDEYATRSRYTYVAVFFICAAVADLLSGSGGLRRVRTRWVRIAALAVMFLYLSSISANVDALKVTRERFLYMARLTQTYFALALAHGDEPWVDGDSRFNDMPAPPDVAKVVERFHYPVDRQLANTRGQPAYEDALTFLIGDRFRVEHSSAQGPASSLELVDASGVEVTTPARRCIRASGNGADAVMRLSVAGGVRVRAMTSSDVAGSVGLGHGEIPNRYLDLPLRRGSPLDVVVPKVGGDPRKWILVLSFPALQDTIVVCGIRARSDSD